MAIKVDIRQVAHRLLSPSNALVAHAEVLLPVAIIGQIVGNLSVYNVGYAINV